MSHLGEARHFPLDLPSAGASASSSTSSAAAAPTAGAADPCVPLMNLCTVRMRMDSVQQFLSQSLNSDTLLSGEQMDLVSSEIVSAIHQIVVNGAALLSCSEQPPASDPPCVTVPPVAAVESGGPELLAESPYIRKLPNVDLEGFLDAMKHVKDEIDVDCEIVEPDAVELLAENIHFCDICGKGFKRDANLRMHMRAHGNQFKTLEALAKPENRCPESSPSTKRTRFSCPFDGCNRNKVHKKFRPLKSMICVKNHFKRSHCPKMYSCKRCNKKSFSVLADLRSHMKHCGETQWKCTCGTSFSRKDKLFGHMALFEGHMPAVDDDKLREVVAVEDDKDGDTLMKNDELASYSLDDGLLEGLLEEFEMANSNYIDDIWSM